MLTGSGPVEALCEGCTSGLASSCSSNRDQLFPWQILVPDDELTSAIKARAFIAE